MHGLETLRRINRNPSLARKGLSCAISVRGSWKNRPPLIGDWKPGERQAQDTANGKKEQEAAPKSRVRKRRNEAVEEAA